MKYYCLLNILFLFLFTRLSFAQDTIVLKNENWLNAKVEEITPDIIKYKLERETDSSLTFLSRDSVSLIKYANGKIDSIESKKIAITNYYEAVDSVTMYWRGRNDARIFYKAGGVFWGTFVASSPAPAYIAPYAWPFAVVATGAAFAATNPKKIIVPDQNLLNNPNYMRGYIKQARKKRLGNVLGGFGLGIGVDFIVVLAVLSSLSWH